MKERAQSPNQNAPRHSRARLLCRGIAAGLACAAFDADAAEAPSLATATIEELMNIRVTTVSREESTVAQSPAAVFVITPEMIRRSGAREIPELFRMVPGMDVARIDGNKWAVGVRGFNTRFQNKLLVQVDGRSIYSLLTAGVFWDAVDYPLEDIERIEIIRGPGASVWGANAVNGIINIITKSSKDTQGGLLVGGGGTEERGFATFRFGGQIGENLHYRAYGKWFDREKQFSLEGDTNDQWRGASGGVRLDWKAGPDDTVAMDARFGRSVAGRKDRFPQLGGPPFALNFPENETVDTAHVRAAWTHTMADSSWKLQAYWDRFDRWGDNGFANVRWDTLDLDFQHQFALGGRQNIVWGLGYRFIDGGLTNSVNDGGFYLTFLDNNPQKNLYSTFVQDEIALVHDRLSLTLGTKLEHNDFTGWEVQPTARLLWTPTKRQSVWAAASRAVRTRTFTEDDAQFTAVPFPPTALPRVRTVANRSLNPEEVWACEMGYRIQATDAFTVDTALFYNVYDELRINRSNPALASTLPTPLLAASQFDNGMNGETYGAELSATLRLTDWWRLSGSYTVLKMNLHRDSDLDPATEAAEGQSPQQQAFLQSSWSLPGDVDFDLIGRYVDRLSGFNPAGLPGVSDTVPAYVSLDVRLSWRPRKNVELSLVGQNLLDNHHPEFGTNPFVRSPLVEIRRGIYGMVKLEF